MTTRPSDGKLATRRTWHELQLTPKDTIANTFDTVLSFATAFPLKSNKKKVNHCCQFGNIANLHTESNNETIS